ncbi:MAG: B12-binding domain-containing radical SAM protein [Lachnospiraceae bacterium]|nr:B12-binding domain-containing radical SAM protein [Lachnospiraceae bacterium]
MKFLLIALNAKYIHSNPAVYCLRSYTAAKDAALADQVVIAEYTINQETDEILQAIYEQKPDVAAFSCYIWNIRRIKELVRELKKVLPGTDIWLGGPEVSFDAGERLKELPEVTGVMRGEGEETVYELVQTYAGKCETGNRYGANAEENIAARLAGIRGITWRDADGEIKENEVRGELDFSELPFAYQDLKEFENRIIYYETSRGCPYSCSYCLSSIDRRVRFRKMELVKKELDFFLTNRVAQVKFVDRTFNCKKSHAMEIWRYIKEHDNGVTNFHFEISADQIDEEELALLSEFRPGLIQLEIGVQSTNPETIRAIRRRMDLTRLKEVTNTIRSWKNIHQHLDLIAGLPYEDYASFRRSFGEVYALRPNQLQLGFLKVLKGAAMEEEAARYGIAYHSEPPYEVLYTGWLSYEEVIRLKQAEEMLEIYYNSGQFGYSVRYLEHYYENPFDLYEELAEEYKASGSAGTKHSRAERFEFLRRFGRKKILGRFRISDVETTGAEEEGSDMQKAEWTEHSEAWDELLFCDFCLREKPKNRPDYAKPQEEYRDWMKNYYDRYGRELRAHTWLHHFEYSPEKTAERGEPVREDAFLLFEYNRRSPMDYSAEVVRYQGEQEAVRQ